ncbi:MULTISPECIES: formylglycine-generating enzyme family protein [Pseudomonas]|uniref:Sulfatase-modifying factor 1 n=2 Tax=Pseudomonas luteola TaxID=47886 RepID=A0A2X2D577_PSELU|nr:MULTISPECIES: formylglycine-generating enzyme family protein [Pseudomonas]SHJ04146.1 Formylglycine-generating enzyme, required for sulfatase activity, contains SUMF1/FGE domain [Pseudomonas zeshuii]SPZ16272.1 sulfatase-modifying factor 1 [Pseudomonas luteola]
MSVRRNHLIAIGALLLAILTGGLLRYLAVADSSPLPGYLCETYDGLPLTRQGREQHGMIQLSAGRFTMGSERFYPEERPAVPVGIKGFWIDRHPVTNAQYAAFVRATGYQTQAERGLSGEAARGLPPAVRLPGSLVFVRSKEHPGWQFIAGANWRNPEGPGSGIETRLNHPVVHVSFDDALAYATWLGRELPSEAQLEYAARGGLVEADYAWGDKPLDHEHPQANTWQGDFPLADRGIDGYRGTSPVGCFPPNGFNLFDMGGNVWELTRTWYRPGHEGVETNNPEGPDTGLDPREPGVPVKVIKGGSHLCAEDYCLRYRPSARQPQVSYLGTSHIGFRTVSTETPTR